MSDSLHDIEQQLCTCLQQQGEQYAGALELAEQLGPHLQSGQLPPDAIARIHEHLRIAAEIEALHRAAKEGWLASGGKPGAEMKTLLDALQSSLEKLLPWIGQAEESVQAAKQRLTPQLEIQSRSARMRNAYASAAAIADTDK